jgi:membrane-associated phospholipid phosphatase
MRVQLVAGCFVLSNFGALTSARAEGVAWQPEWRKSGAADYTFTGVSFVAAALGIALLSPTSSGPWQRPILVDGQVRSALRAETRAGRDGAGLASDIVGAGTLALVIADVGIAAFGHQKSDVAWELFALDAEAYAATLLLNTAVKYTVRRPRPYAEACESDASYDSHCGKGERFVSFFSQHSALSATGAGLMCATHSRLSLYGEGFDMAGCFAGIALAATAGVLRIVSDNHWTSDVLTGQLVGFGVGYFLPRLLHFHNGERPTEDVVGEALRLPRVGVARDAFQLSWSGRF